MAERLAVTAKIVIEKLVDLRGEDNAGEGDEWSTERLATCTDDYTYDLAVEIRKMRAQGTSWWRIAYELHLPGSGASAKQGGSGASLARRVWRAAWGKTYESEAVPREGKGEKVQRVFDEKARPYFAADAKELDVIKAMAGRLVQWCTRLQTPGGAVVSLQETFVHKDLHLIKIKQGPRGRYVEFFEQPDPELLRIDPHQAIAKSGPLRSVYLDRIVKVGA